MKPRIRHLLIFLLPAVVAIGVLWYLFFQPPPPSPASLSEAPIPKVKALDWDTLRTSLEQMDAFEIRQHGVRIFQQGNPDNAFLLFKAAAKKGDGWSAIAVGEMYDPATFSAADFDEKKTAFSKPNPRKALEWYDRALAQGEAQAQARRDTLIAHLKKAAAGGDTSAGKLLKKFDR